MKSLSPNLLAGLFSALRMVRLPVLPTQRPGVFAPVLLVAIDYGTIAKQLFLTHFFVPFFCHRFSSGRRKGTMNQTSPGYTCLKKRPFNKMPAVGFGKWTVSTVMAIEKGKSVSAAFKLIPKNATGKIS